LVLSIVNVWRGRALTD